MDVFELALRLATAVVGLVREGLTLWGALSAREDKEGR